MNGYFFDQDLNGWESLIEGMPAFEKFLPLANNIKISNYIKGLSNYTPDGNFVLGAYPDLDGFIAATGCAGAGIAMSGGIGRFISELVVGLAPFIDSAPHRIDRFSAVDLMNCEFIQSCADARAGKVTG